MNTTTLGGKTVYDPPPGSLHCNFFEETAGASRYGYGIFCLLGKDYKALLTANAKTVRLVMKSDQAGAEAGIEMDVVLGRARLCSSSVKDVSDDSSTYESSFVNVVVYDITYLLGTADVVGNFNVTNTTSVDISTPPDEFYPSTLNAGGTVEWTWEEVFAEFNFTAPPSGYRATLPRNLIFNYLPRNRVADRFAAINAWIVGRTQENPDVYTTQAALAASLRFYNPGEAAASNTTLLEESRKYLLETTPLISSNTAAHLPNTMRCIFPIYNKLATDPYAHSAYNKDITVGGTSDNIFILPLGEFPAFWDEDTSTVLNQAELDTIAAELAPLFFNILSREVNGGVVSCYAGIIPFEIDGVILSIRWESTQRGARTFISYDKIRTFSPLDELYGSMDTLANQSIAYMGHGNSGLSASGTKFIWGNGAGGIQNIRYNTSTNWLQATYGSDAESSWVDKIQFTSCPGSSVAEFGAF